MHGTEAYRVAIETTLEVAHAGAALIRERDGFSLVCGRYEGLDQRVADHLCDDEISVGDHVLAGGEAAALVVMATRSAAATATICSGGFRGSPPRSRACTG